MRTRPWMMAAGIALFLAAPASADPASSPPTIDCAAGFEGIRAQVSALPGIQQASQDRFDVVTLSAPDTWRVSIAFTRPDHPAHPSVVMRTSRKQVTGVWTAESKGCGFGDSSVFAALMAEMKTEDSRLTNESRAVVERERRDRSPLSPSP
ncbi:hypothetical protein [Hyphomicrobium methylovorum]|uniref:hypothetical protein n=1 Tax=Hyphomicrobium methylovorum TaxID=84 RepID=UPI001FE39494|nr:hypothetical protein [Hyphomicrobium methylovorum]